MTTKDDCLTRMQMTIFVLMGFYSDRLLQ